MGSWGNEKWATGWKLSNQKKTTSKRGMEKPALIRIGGVRGKTQQQEEGRREIR